MLRFIFVAVTLALAAASISAHADTYSAQPLKSGIYTIQSMSIDGAVLKNRKIYLAFNKNVVTGYFNNPYPEEEGADTDGSCRFSIFGKANTQSSIELRAIDLADAPYNGSEFKLTRQSDDTWLVTFAERDLWKAAVCEHPTLVSGDIIKLAVPRPWAFIGTISTPKEPLFSEPSVDQKTKAYLVKDDPVAILVLNGKSQISNNGFQQIDYLGGAHELIRWVKDGPVYYPIDR